MDIQKTALRLPKDLHQMVNDAAKQAGHSMNAEIIARLRSSFENNQLHSEELKQVVRELIREELAKVDR